jgi:NADPH-dependent 2,4-dienoyl-CoA reductase/sulfur reductase-like enzyme
MTSVTIVDRGGAATVQCSALVLATGARELFLPFPGWTLPWVLGAGGAQALHKEGTRMAGKRVVVAGSGPLLLAVAATLAKAGARVTHVLEQAHRARLAAFSARLIAHPARLLQAARYSARAGVWRYSSDSWVARAQGRERVESVTAMMRGRSVDIPCEVLCTGFGLTPSVELALAAGCATARGAVVVDEEQRTSVEGVWCVGEPTGIAGVDNAVTQGVRAGLSILGAAVDPALARALERGRRDADLLSTTFALRREVLNLATPETVVCRCEDVREGELGSGAGWRELKLRTRLGMGACQGRICGAALSARRGIGPEDARAPIFPVPVGSLIRPSPHEG